MAIASPVRGRRSERLRQAEMVELIGRVPVFRRCTKRDLRLIAGITTVVDLPAGRQLTREGEPGREFAVIVAGAVEVTRGKRRIRKLGPGDWLGEIALLTGGPRTATATTVAPTRVLLIRGGMFRSLLEATPSLAFRVLERVAALVPDEERRC